MLILPEPGKCGIITKACLHIKIIYRRGCSTHCNRFPIFPRMNTIKLVSAVALLSLLASSCAKEAHTCVCKDVAGPLQDQRYKIETTTQQRAVSKCADHETDLNQSNSSYHCYLEQ